MPVLEQERQLQTDQTNALRRTVEELTHMLAEASAGERPGLGVAFAELAQGNSLAAEHAFECEYEAKAHVADSARRTMAEAARNVANLALLRDVSKAVEFYRKALAVEPEHAETAWLLGHALILLGDLKGAETALSQALAAATSTGAAWGAMAAHGELGDVFRGTGDLAAANSAFAAALRLAEKRLATNPFNFQWQHDISVCHDRIGDVLMAQGDAPAALASYRRGLVIRRTLALHDPTNTQWQNDLSWSRQGIGDVLMIQGDLLAALSAYRTGLVIRKALVERDRANTEWQRDLALSYNKIGDVLLYQSDEPAALAAYRSAFAIADALAASDPANTGWQRELSVSHRKIGDALLIQGDWPAALVAHRTAFAISEALAARDAANTMWQRDLLGSHVNIGDVLLAQGDQSAALDSADRWRVLWQPEKEAPA